MTVFDKKLQAHQLRRKGVSIRAIASELGVAKSTVSLWCRDISLTSEQRDLLHRRQVAQGHRGRMIGAEVNRKKKEENIKT